LPPKKNLKLSAVRLRRLSEFSRGEFLAAAGGESGSDYLKNTAPSSTQNLHVRNPLKRLASISVFVSSSKFVHLKASFFFRLSLSTIISSSSCIFTKFGIKAMSFQSPNMFFINHSPISIQSFHLFWFKFKAYIFLTTPLESGMLAVFPTELSLTIALWQRYTLA